MRLGRRFPPATDCTADFEKLSRKVHIAPLQADEFALPEARADRTKEQGVVQAPPIVGDAEQRANFVGCQRIDVQVRRLTRARHPSEMRHRIGRYESVIDRVLIRFFQGRENVVNGPLLPTLGDERGDQGLQVDPGHVTQTAGPERRENVLTHHLSIPLSGGRLAVGLGIDGEPLREDASTVGIVPSGVARVTASPLCSAHFSLAANLSANAFARALFLPKNLAFR